ncbi:alpha/beta fold hydrolase [Pendulispora albinea]|uniref:Alpha/beta hydrolase n=1 Tax=Pendulispora albinea TaxID=2741071 RepID=A0ABZ2M9K7_9BACT
MNRLDIEVDGNVFSTLHLGDPARPLVLCAHGFPDHPSTFESLASVLVRAGYRVVAPWLRGYFPSTLAGPYDARSIARDLVAIADHLSPAQPIRLIGHNWGAVAAYEAIEHWPHRFHAAVTMAVPHRRTYVRNLTFAQIRSNLYMLFLSLPIVAQKRVIRDDFAFVDRLWRDWAPGYTPNPEYMRAIKDCLRQSLPAPIRYYRAMLADLGWLIRSVLAGSADPIRVPTLHLQGAVDPCVLPETAAGQESLFSAPYASVLVQGAGHFPHLEAKEIVGGLVTDWFYEHANPSERGQRAPFASPDRATARA